MLPLRRGQSRHGDRRRSCLTILATLETPNYGLTKFADLFTPRQLVALTTFSDLVDEARERVHKDAVASGLPADNMPLDDGGTGGTRLRRRGGDVSRARRK